MFSIQAFLTCKSNLPDKLQTPQPICKIPYSQPYERQHSITQINSLIGSHKSTISRELHRNLVSRGCRPRQVSELAIERSE